MTNIVTIKFSCQNKLENTKAEFQLNGNFRLNKLLPLNLKQ